VIASPLLVAAALALPHGAAPGLRAADFSEIAGEREFSGALIVRPRQDLGRADRARAIALLGGWTHRHNPRTDDFVLEVAPVPLAMGASEKSVAERLMKTGLFQYACPDWTLYPLATPDDPRYPEQWHHAMMQSALAWDIVRADGASEIIIAVTDTGIVPHEDLGNRVPGFNSASDIAEADGGDLTDIHGHGTHVAGCAAAAGNNGVGVSGLGWNFRIMPVRVSEAANGGAAMSNLLEGVQWAAQNGAKVISTSYSGIGYEPIETTGQFVRSLDASMLWAAGNSGTNHSGWDFPSVLVVGASNQSDQRAGFSGYGRGVDLFAPGVSILSSTRDGAYGFASGTSMATPVANGALALVRSANPALSAAHAEHILQNSCDFWGVADNEAFGWGRINLLRAVEYAVSAASPQAPIARDDRVTTTTDTSVELDVLANDFDANMDPLEIQSFSAATSGGAAVTLIEGGAGARDRLLVSNTGGVAGEQTLSYTLVEPVSGATSTAVATIATLATRPADNPTGTTEGVQVGYYALTAPTALPDFGQLQPYAGEVLLQIDLGSTNGNFAGSGRADDVGAVFTGWIDIPTRGIWTLGVTSDDGSRLYIGDDLVADNDGLHGMTTVTGTRALAAGKHALRVEFFEAGGGAGVILSWAPPGGSSGTVPASRLSHGGTATRGDIDGDGAVDSVDIALLLSAWGTADIRADLDGSGQVGSADITILLANWTG
jgi:subtilisin family serine protease